MNGRTNWKGQTGSRKTLLRLKWYYYWKKYNGVKLDQYDASKFTRKWSKKLEQRWKWRWNRKSSNAWKHFRFLSRYNAGSSKQLRIKKSFMTTRILQNMVMWRYNLRFRQLPYLSQGVLNKRLDSTLVMLKKARNISIARNMVMKGQVIVNGSIIQNYNYFIASSDVIQTRNSKHFERTETALSLPNNFKLLKTRYLI